MHFWPLGKKYSDIPSPILSYFGYVVWEGIQKLLKGKQFFYKFCLPEMLIFLGYEDTNTYGGTET